MSESKPQRTWEQLVESLEKTDVGDLRTRGKQPSARSYGSYHQAAAVLSTFNSETLEPFGKPVSEDDDVEMLLADCIILPDVQRGARWELQPEIRRDVLQQMGSRKVLQEALTANPQRPQDTIQTMLEAYIQGDARPVEKQEVEQLTASLHVVEWLGDVLPDLPDRLAIRQRYEAISLLQPFRDLAGEHFRGRVEELQQLRDYMEVLPPGSIQEHVRRLARDIFDLKQNPPLMIHAPGGMGKSALVARFIWEHTTLADAQKFPWIYIDFDRFGLRPEEPLTLLVEGVRQLGIQYPDARSSCDRLRSKWLADLSQSSYKMRRQSKKASDFSQEGLALRASGPDEWKRYLGNFANLLDNLKTEKAPLLFVLDTFEEVQYHGNVVVDSLLRFLGIFQEHVPRLRTVIAGRIPLEGFEEFPINYLPLKNFDEEAKKGFLEGRGVAPPSAVNMIAEHVPGHPLSLVLAAELYETVKKEGDKFDISDIFGLQESQIQGVLFERILEHIRGGEEIKKLAHPGLALRRITPDLIREVLAGPCGVVVQNDADAQRLFDGLKKEMFLVRVEGEALIHRTDLRQITIQLLREREPDKVKRIDENAVDYYKRQPGPVARAEEIYHRLMLQQSYEALGECWRDGKEVALNLLYNAVDELPNVRERAWLKTHLGFTLTLGERRGADREGLERDTAERVRELLEHDRPREAVALLKEVPDYMPGSWLYALETQVWDTLEEWEKARSVIDKGLKSAQESENKDLAIELHIRSARLFTRLAEYEKARQSLEQAEEHIKKRPVHRITVGLEHLTLDRLEGRAPQKSQQVKEKLCDELGELSDADVRKRPDLMGRLAGELGEEFPDILWRVVRLTGLKSDLQAPLRELGRALADWDRQISKTAKQAPGLLARKVGIPERGTLEDTWSIYVLEESADDLSQLVMALKAQYTTVARPVRAAIARLLAGRAAQLAPRVTTAEQAIDQIPAETTDAYIADSLKLTGQEVTEFSQALIDAFPSLDKLGQMLQFRLDKNLAAIAISSTLREVVFRLIEVAEAEGWTTQLLVAAMESNPHNSKLLDFAAKRGLTAVKRDEKALEVTLQKTQSFLDTSQWRELLGRLEPQVCRIEISATGAFGTGFLVGPDIVLTAYHVVEGVINESIEPQDVVLRFDFKSLEGKQTIYEGTVYRLAADWLVDYSKYSQVDVQAKPESEEPRVDELDYALLRVAGAPGKEPVGGKRAESDASRRGWIEMPAQFPDLSPDTPLMILHHPEGGPLKLSMDNTGIIGLNANRTRLWHRVVTAPGSAGAPCFNTNWELVAIHHSGGFRTGALASISDWVLSRVSAEHETTYNEAIPLDAILSLLEERGKWDLLGEERDDGERYDESRDAYRAPVQVDESIAHYQQALAKARQEGNRREEAVQWTNLGLVYYNLGQGKRAIECYQQALAIFREIGDRAGEGMSLGNLGFAYSRLVQMERAIEYYQQALAIFREIGNRAGEGTSLGNLGLAYHDLGRVEEAVACFQQALEIAQETGDQQSEGRHLGSLGLAYRDLGHVERAIECFQQALAIAREIGDRQSEGKHLGSLGLAYRDLGHVERAIECFQQALAIAREIGDRLSEGRHLGSLGLAHRDLGHVENAIECFQKALETAREIGDRLSEGRHLGSLGLTHRDLGQIEQAIDCLQSALAIAREIGDRQSEGRHLGSLGLAYQDRGEVSKATQTFKDALSIFREIGDRRGERESLGNWGLAYLKLALVEPAKSYLEKSLALFDDIKSPSATLFREALDTSRDKSKNDWCKVFFLTDPVMPGQEPVFDRSPMEETLIAAIESAQESIDLSLFEFDLQQGAEALLRAHQRGVQVRIVTDDEYGIEADSDQLVMLMNGGIPVIDDGRTSLMHSHYIIFDRESVWLGTSSPTARNYARNYDHAVWIDSAELAGYFRDDFEGKFTDQRFFSPEMNHHFSIEDTSVELYLMNGNGKKLENRLLELIESAEKSVRFMAFAFTLDSIGKKMIERINAGVEIDGVFDNVGNAPQHSQIPALFHAGARLYYHGNERTHEKTLIIDESIVITQSANLTANSIMCNNEYSLILHNRDIAQSFLGYFRLLADRGEQPSPDYFDR
jgi:tetratricopeptide (TPR) repeat protein